MLTDFDADSTTDVRHDEIHCSAEQGRRQNASLPYSGGGQVMNGAERRPAKRTLADHRCNVQKMHYGVKIGEKLGKEWSDLTPNERVLTVWVPVYGVKFHQN